MLLLGRAMQRRLVVTGFASTMALVPLSGKDKPTQPKH